MRGRFEAILGLSVLCAFFFSSITVGAGEFVLRINDISGLHAPWPLIGSLPFPKGELKDPSAIRMMDGDHEVPLQLDVAATWRDGSIRWALAGFTASPQGEYRVQYGKGVKRGVYPDPLKVRGEEDGGFAVDTGAAVCQFDGDKLLPENAWLVSENRRIRLLERSGAGVYLVDNKGRTARPAGATAEIENDIVKEGLGRFVVRRARPPGNPVLD